MLYNPYERMKKGTATHDRLEAIAEEMKTKAIGDLMAQVAEASSVSGVNGDYFDLLMVEVKDRAMKGTLVIDGEKYSFTRFAREFIWDKGGPCKKSLDDHIREMKKRLAASKGEAYRPADDHVYPLNAQPTVVWASREGGVLHLGLYVPRLQNYVPCDFVPVHRVDVHLN